MESPSYNSDLLVAHTLRKLIDACDMIAQWNVNVTSTENYTCSPEGMQVMAATCMLLEAIGEGVKKIDKLTPGFLGQEPEIPWREIKGLRDHIAHGYFNLDAEIIYDVAVKELPALKSALERLIELLNLDADR